MARLIKVNKILTVNPRPTTLKDAWVAIAQLTAAVVAITAKLDLDPGVSDTDFAALDPETQIVE